MYAKTNTWIQVLGAFLFVMLLVTLSLPAGASAAQAAGLTSNSCLTCHEDWYYLHDWANTIASRKGMIVA